MKKFLSLVLALVMTMSLVTISAGAEDFADNGEITYKEAVDVISALDVVDGYTGGSFNPKGNLTRGAAAKIICNLILGPTTASALVADTAPYSDVPANHTFAGYIAYCQQQGIISGYADGTFKPANPLTGYAFMKMLLGALGYDATVEGYVGANWSVQVAKQAIAIGLDDGNDSFNGVATVNREEAALYAFNTLTADMVEYSQKTEINTGSAVVTVSGGRREADNNISDDYRTANKDTVEQFCERYFGKLELRVGENSDAFGRPANTWYNGKTKIGTYAKEADFTYYADKKAKELYKDIDDTDYYLFVDGEDTNVTFTVNKTSTTKLSVASGETVGTGSLVEVFEDDQVITVVNTYLLKVAADYDEDTEILELTTIADQAVPTEGWLDLDLESDDYDGLDAYEEDDYVAVTVADGIIKSLTKVEPVIATVTEYVDTESVTADGTEHSYNVTNTNNAKQYDLKAEYELYLDANGNVLFADGVDAEENYMYVAEFYAHTSSARGALNAFAYLTDGTEIEATISEIDGTKVYGTSYSTQTTGWYTYTEKNGKYELEPIGDANSDDVLNTGIATETINGDEYVTNYDEIGTKLGDNTDIRGNSATIFVVVDEDDDVKAYTGIKNVPDIYVAGAGYADVVTNGRYAKVVFIDVDTGDVEGGANSSDLVYILSFDKEGTDKDDTDYYRYKAIVNGKETKIKTLTDVAVTIDALHNGVEYDEAGYVVDIDAITAPVADEFEYDTVSSANVTVKGNTINFVEGAVSYSYYLAEDGYTIYVIDTAAEDVVKTVSTSKLANDYKAGKATLAADITAVLNDDGDVTALYINK